MKKYLIILILFMGLPLTQTMAQLPENLQESWTEMHNSKDQALQEFNKAKFGMFIHWGLYSELAAEWQGKRIPGLSEWIMYHAKISKADYGNLAKNFNPVQFNAE